MTLAPPGPEKPARPFLTGLGAWATDARTVLAALGIVLYAVLRIAYSVFYHKFGLTPDDLGLSYLDLLIQSAVGTVILLMAIFVVTAAAVAVYAGIVTDQYAKQEGESHPTKPWVDRAVALGTVALLVLALYGAYVVDSPALYIPAFLLLTVHTLIAGIKRIKSELTGKRHTRWRMALGTIALATLGLAIFSLLVRAERDATRVQLGHASSFTVLGFQITTWGAEEATVSWTSNQVAADLMPLADQCLMYLGQSNGTAFLYLARTHEVFRVPTAIVVVRTQPAVCNRS
jgi:hypothetical protein